MTNGPLNLTVRNSGSEVESAGKGRIQQGLRWALLARVLVNSDDRAVSTPNALTQLVMPNAALLSGLQRELHRYFQPLELAAPK
jgi:hypothetical protein